MINELRFSVRGLRKSPGFTIVAVCTLALAIGANAVVFGVLNALILRPLNVPQADTLYGIERASDNTMPQSYPDYVDLRDRNRSFDGLAAYSIAPAALDTGTNSSHVWLEEVSGNYFDVLGIQPYLGRLLHGSDEHGANSAPYIVLSHTYWKSHFAGDTGVLGRTVQLNKHPFTIIGVTPADFRGTFLVFSPDFFVPIINQEQIEGINNLDSRGTRDAVFMAMGHLRAGITKAQAIADLDSIGSYLENNYPKYDVQMRFTLARPSLFGDQLGGPVRAFMAGLMLLAGLILLAACTNLGSLFAARAADRAREFALRLALGSSHKRVLLQLFSEAVLISLIGGTLGLLGSIVLLRWLSMWQPSPRVPLHLAVNPDPKVYAVAFLLAMVSGVLFGVVPVRQVLHTNPYEVVKAGSIGGVGRRITVRDVLLVAQIAICAVLVTSSLVAIRGMVRSLRSNFGFEPQNAVLAQIDLNMGGYKGDRLIAMQQRMIEVLAAIPGVKSVGLVDRVPLNSAGVRDSNVFTDETTDLKLSNAAADASMCSISPEYFHASATVLLSGRTFTWHDDKKAPAVAIVNRQFAVRIFGSVTGAIGRYYKMPDGTRIQVVGIVQDGKYESLAEDPRPAMFFPILQSPSSETYLVVRSDRDQAQVAGAMKSALHDLDAGLPFLIEPWSKELDAALFPSRVATMSLGVLGFMAAMLAVTGISGMAAYSVSRRLREFGIRIALGAQRRQVLQAVFGRLFKLLAIGSAAGLFLGLLASRVLAFIVYQATPRDPMVLAGVVLTMSVLAVIASWVPARRAISVDPIILMREQ